MRKFNTIGLCVPEEDYMVDISDRLKVMKEMIKEGQFFTINRGRQYGKTTTLAALERYLGEDYDVVSLDFQDLGESSFETEEKFCRDFTEKFCEIITETFPPEKQEIQDTVRDWMDYAEKRSDDFRLVQLFGFIQKICKMSEHAVVLLIDEVDSAANNQVFLDFLAQLRSLYLKRKKNPRMKTFQSVILASVTDVKNLKRKIHPEEVHKVNSPWNIAVDFNYDMSFSAEGIAGMLSDYERDHHTGMDVEKMAQEIRDYTSGYPFLVCRICQILDQELPETERFGKPGSAWTKEGVDEAVRMLVSESNTLFDSLMGKMVNRPEMYHELEQILFSGEDMTYNQYNLAIGDALMYGFIRVSGNTVKVANRIFEMLLYNYYLSENEMKNTSIYKSASHDREQFIGKEENMGKTMIIDHPLIKHKISLLRDETTGTRDFRILVEEIAMLMGYEALRDLPTELVEVKTPITNASVPMIAGRKLAVVSILRAGLGMVNGILSLVPSAKIGHIGLYRDEETHEPHEYFCKLPEQINERLVILPDPMLATGGSAIQAVDFIKEKGCTNIKFMCIIAAPEGLEALQKAHPDIEIYVGTLDERLNEDAYIVPGLGDAGDRIFGTK